MRKPVFRKVRKLSLLVLRKLSRKLAPKYRVAQNVYYWADMKIYRMGKVYPLPAGVYRFLKWVCNLIASKNTVDHNGVIRLRSRKLQRMVEKIIHIVPDEIRFKELLKDCPRPAGQIQTLTK